MLSMWRRAGPELVMQSALVLVSEPDANHRCKAGTPRMVSLSGSASKMSMDRSPLGRAKTHVFARAALAVSGPARNAVGSALGCLKDSFLTLLFAFMDSQLNKDAVVEAGAVPCLVRLLRCGKAHAVTKNAATAVMVLSYAHAANRHLLRKAGALPELAKLLRAGPEAPVTEKAAWALSNLVRDPSVRLPSSARMFPKWTRDSLSFCHA